MHFIKFKLRMDRMEIIHCFARAKQKKNDFKMTCNSSQPKKNKIYWT